MKNSIFNIIIALFSTALTTDQVMAQYFSWAQGFTAVGSPYQATILSSTIDSTGNIYNVGWFGGTLDIDPGPNVQNLVAVGNGNMFLLKEDSAGNIIWARHFAGMSAGVYGMYGHGIDVDVYGNIYLAGAVRDSFDVDPGPGIYNLSTNGGLQAFILKLDPSGNFIWAKTVKNTIIVNNTAGYFDIKAVGDKIYAAGYFAGTVDADPGTAQLDITSAGSADLIVEKLDTAGNFIWVRTIGGIGGDHIKSLSVDSFSNLYFTGFFEDTVDFDPGVAIHNLVSKNGKGGIFILKLDSAGIFQWAKNVGGSNITHNVGFGISVDRFNDIAITGAFSGPVDFDPGPGIYTLTPNATRSVFTMKLRNNGDFAWAKMVGSHATNSEGLAVAIDSIGNIYTVAHIPGGCDMDPGPGTYIVPGDVVVQKLDSAGNFAWARGWEGETPLWIGLDLNNSVYTSGSYSGLGKDFDPGPGTFLLSGGGGFVHKLHQSPINKVVEEEFVHRDVSVYPNPSSGSVTFSSKAVIKNIEIRDVTGSVIYKVDLNTLIITIDLKTQTPGMYFYSVNMGEMNHKGKLLLQSCDN